MFMLAWSYSISASGYPLTMLVSVLKRDTLVNIINVLVLKKCNNNKKKVDNVQMEDNILLHKNEVCLIFPLL